MTKSELFERLATRYPQLVPKDAEVAASSISNVAGSGGFWPFCDIFVFGLLRHIADVQNRQKETPP
jgi:hypothetical protein